MQETVESFGGKADHEYVPATLGEAAAAPEHAAD